MKKLSIPALVVAATLAASFAGAQGATVNGKHVKGTQVIKVKDPKTVKSVTATGKKHRKKFLGIF